MWKTVSFFFFFSSRRRHTRSLCDLEFRRVLFRSFLVGQGTEYWKLFQTGVDLSTNMFSTTFFTLTGFHGLHVLMGLIALLIFLWMAWEGDFVRSEERRVGKECRSGWSKCV